MNHEIAVALPRRPRQVLQIAPDAPLAPSAALLRRAEEERRRQEQRAADEERRQVAAAVAGLTRAAAALKADVDRMRREMETAAAELATLIASRLVHRVIDARAFGVGELVRELTGRLDGGRGVTVFLHPDDLKLLRGRAAPDEPGLEWKADASLGRGDCRAAAGDVSLLSHWREQLADLSEQLRRSAAHEPQDA